MYCAREQVDADIFYRLTGVIDILIRRGTMGHGCVAAVNDLGNFFLSRVQIRGLTCENTHCSLRNEVVNIFKEVKDYLVSVLLYSKCNESGG